MASEDTNIGNELTFQVGTATSPPTFTDFTAVISPGSIGEEAPQIDVTALTDDARRYRRGLPDGASITLECLFSIGDVNIPKLYKSFKNRITLPYRLVIDGTSPEDYFQFDASVLGWNAAVPVGDKVTVTFTLKISGIVTPPTAWSA